MTRGPCSHCGRGGESLSPLGPGTRLHDVDAWRSKYLIPAFAAATPEEIPVIRYEAIGILCRLGCIKDAAYVADRCLERALRKRLVDVAGRPLPAEKVRTKRDKVEEGQAGREQRVDRLAALMEKANG